MTEGRKFQIALHTMCKVISEKFSEEPDDEAVDRQACADGGYLNGGREVETLFLRGLMKKLAHWPTPKDLQKMTRREGEAAYHWMMFHVTQRSWDINNTLRRWIGNEAEDLELSEGQLIEFYRQLLIDAVNFELRQLKDEGPLLRKH